MSSLQDAIERAAVQGAFSGVVRVDQGQETLLCAAYGRADRAHDLPNRVDTLFGIASGTKGLTALVVMALVERGQLELGGAARALLGDDLPLVTDDVTIKHLLAHRSGIGDYFDEDDADLEDHVLPVPVHELSTTEDYLAVLQGHESAFRAGEGFAYNNTGYVLLALLAERATGTPFPELVRTLVCEPAGMVDTAFLRSDALPGRAAAGYLAADGLRTNVLHLPVRGSGDGGAYATVADLQAFWEALFAGRIVSRDRVAEMVRPLSHWPDRSYVSARDHRRYGLGFHLHATGDQVWLEGYDTGVSFASLHDPSASLTWTVVSNWTDGAWPVVRVLRDWFGT